MTAFGDYTGEMPEPDDDSINALLSGACAEGDGFDALADFVREVGFVVNHETPQPSPELTAFLGEERLTDALPTVPTDAVELDTKEHAGMTLIRNTSTIGRIAAGAAVLAFGLTATAAAGVLPIGSSSPPTKTGVVVAADSAVDAKQTPASPAPATDADAAATADAGAVTTGTDAAVDVDPHPQPSADTTTEVQTTVEVPEAPPVPLPDPGQLPIPIPIPTETLEGLEQLPGQVMTCLTPILDGALDATTGLPIGFGFEVVGPIVDCVETALTAVPLPFGMDTCVSSIFAMISSLTSGGFMTGLPTGLPSFDFTACVPTGDWFSIVDDWTGFMDFGGLGGGFMPTDFLSGFLGGGQ